VEIKGSEVLLIGEEGESMQVVLCEKLMKKFEMEKRVQLFLVESD
jgi:hypothetical protein